MITAETLQLLLIIYQADLRRRPAKWASSLILPDVLGVGRARNYLKAFLKPDSLAFARLENLKI